MGIFSASVAILELTAVYMSVHSFQGAEYTQGVPQCRLSLHEQCMQTLKADMHCAILIQQPHAK